MVPLIILLLVLVLVVFPLWALFRILALGRENNAIASQLTELGRQLNELRDSVRATPPPSSPAAGNDRATAAAAGAAPHDSDDRADLNRVTPGSASGSNATALHATHDDSVDHDSSRWDSVRRHGSAGPVTGVPPLSVPTESSTTPPIAEPPVFLPPPRLQPPARPRINWEQFMGAKLFAWLGGLAAFLGAAFFVKYSFEHDLILARNARRHWLSLRDWADHRRPQGFRGLAMPRPRRPSAPPASCRSTPSRSRATRSTISTSSGRCRLFC